MSFGGAIDQVFSLMGAQFHKRQIQIKVSTDNEPNVFAHPGSVEQVLINLLTNARDAIESARMHDKKRGRIKLSVSQEDGQVFLRVQDDGCGMDLESKQKIFNPFFTTKDPGKGMGLGLSMSLSLARAMGGDLCLESSSASGSTFVLKLPLVQTKRLREAA